MIEVLLLGFIVFILTAIIVGIMEWKVKSVSTAYSKLTSINKQYNFHQLEPVITITAELGSKKEFDSTEFDNLFEQILLDNSYQLEIDNLIKKAESNKEFWKDYKDKTLNIDTSYRNIENKKAWMTFNTYVKVEKRIIEKAILSKPTTSLVFQVIKTYTSPAGRNSYRSHQDFSVSDVYKYRELIKEKMKNEKAYKRTTNYQRKLMTPSLRYDILKRDEFKCQICGYSQEDGVKLHVDHIIPVAKGGKTEPKNLRALCSDCNSGKSAKYDPQGVN